MIDAKCPVGGCPKTLGVGPTTGRRRLFCPSHWRRIPRPLQIRISQLHLSTEKTYTRGSLAALTIVVRLAIDAAERPRRRRR